MAKKRSFADAFARYKTYDTSTGYGSVAEWSNQWESMGLDEAIGHVKDGNPLEILGFTSLPTADELKKRYRTLIMQNQEKQRADASVEDQEFVRRLIAAYTVLNDRISRKG